MRKKFSRRKSRDYVVKKFQNVVIAANNDTIIKLDETEKSKTFSNEYKKRLCDQRKLIASDLCTVFGLAGLILMVIDNELMLNEVYTEVNILV